jgi:enediyne biosynthesis protein E4
VRTDGSYLSASDPRVHVGLGASSAVQSVIVQWPDGPRERWTDISADRLVTLKRGSSKGNERKELPATSITALR